MSIIRLKKVLRDLLISKSRTILAISALAIGIAGVGFSLSAYAVLVREIDHNYMLTNPASVIITSENCDEAFINELKKNPLIKDIEPRREIAARYKLGENTWVRMRLFVIDDFTNIRIDKLSPEIGNWPVKEGEILLERAGEKQIKDNIGDNVMIMLASGKAMQLKYTGQAYAPGISPAWMEGLQYGFISKESYAKIGEQNNFVNLHIVVANNNLDKNIITDAAVKIKASIEATGRKVSGVVIPNPGKHPNAETMNSLLFMVQVLGVMALILSSVLILNLISSQLSQQVRQIGIMKVLGGQSGQIARIYITSVLIIGCSGLIIGIPLGLYIGNQYAAFTAKILNFEIYSNFVPAWVYIVQITSGIGLPLIASMYPILKGKNNTVYNALNDYGVDTGKLGNGTIDKTLEKIKFVKRPVMLSLRNTFRKKGRLTLTLATLTLGGAIFIVSMNFRDSLVYTVNKVFQTKKYDLQVVLSKEYPALKLEETLKGLKEAQAVYPVGGAPVARIRKDGTRGETFRITALPLKKDLITPEMMYGTWLSGDGSNEIVINQKVYIAENKTEKINIGDKVKFGLNGKAVEFRVTGIAREPASTLAGYIDMEYYNKSIGTDGFSNNILIVTKGHSKDEQASALKSVEKALKDNGYESIFNAYTLSYYKKIIDEHLYVIFLFLLVVSIFIVIVGGMGLSSTMGINVMERKREIGIMRAIGASNYSILSIVTVESIIIGLVSWIFAVIIAPLLSIYEAKVFGEIFFGTGLDVQYSVTGSLIWLGFSLVVSVAASAYPAWKASKISVKEALHYE